MPELKPVIFLAFANEQADEARYLRGLAQELRGIRNALLPARQAQAVEVVERANATLSDILDVFQDPAYAGRIRVFHYGGHAESYRLLLESESGSGQVAHAEGFNQFLAQQGSLQLVFLNGCSTRAQAFGLREAGIPAVIATSQAIQDDIAQRFAIRFYKGLAGAASIQKGFADAAAEILTLTGSQNLRSLFAGEPEEAGGMPWLLLPDPPPDWRLDGLRPPGSSEALKLGRYAHVLCNRYRQNDQFLTAHTQTAQDRRPRVYLVHGHRDERHESLVTRFSYQYIGEKQQYLPPVEVRNWPFEGDVQTLLKVRLAEQFDGLNKVQKPVAQLGGQDLIRQASLAGRPAIIVQHHIPAEYWNAGTAQLIRWYAGEFWNTGSAQPEAPLFAVFLNVLYSDEVKAGGGLLGRLFSKGYDRSRIAAELKGIAGAYPDTCTLLPELESVRKPHVEDWLIETNLTDVEECAGLAGRLFGGGVETLVMNTVETQLKQLIRSLQEKYTVQWA
jgi:hypothetical protein